MGVGVTRCFLLPRYLESSIIAGCRTHTWGQILFDSQSVKGQSATICLTSGCWVPFIQAAVLAALVPPFSRGSCSIEEWSDIRAILRCPTEWRTSGIRCPGRDLFGRAEFRGHCADALPIQQKGTKASTSQTIMRALSRMPDSSYKDADSFPLGDRPASDQVKHPTPPAGVAGVDVTLQAVPSSSLSSALGRVFVFCFFPCAACFERCFSGEKAKRTTRDVLTSEQK